MKFFSDLAMLLGLISSASAAMVGGWREMPTDDAGVIAATTFAVREVTHREGVNYQIVKAEAQVTVELSNLYAGAINFTINWCHAICPSGRRWHEICYRGGGHRNHGSLQTIQN